MISSCNTIRQLLANHGSVSPIPLDIPWEYDREAWSKPPRIEIPDTDSNNKACEALFQSFVWDIYVYNHNAQIMNAVAIQYQLIPVAKTQTIWRSLSKQTEWVLVDNGYTIPHFSYIWKPCQSMINEAQQKINSYTQWNVKIKMITINAETNHFKYQFYVKGKRVRSGKEMVVPEIERKTDSVPAVHVLNLFSSYIGNVPYQADSGVQAVEKAFGVFGKRVPNKDGTDKGDGSQHYIDDWILSKQLPKPKNIYQHILHHLQSVVETLTFKEGYDWSIRRDDKYCMGLGEIAPDEIFDQSKGWMRYSNALNFTR
eukprot:14757_1